MSLMISQNQFFARERIFLECGSCLLVFCNMTSYQRLAMSPLVTSSSIAVINRDMVYALSDVTSSIRKTRLESSFRSLLNTQLS